MTRADRRLTGLLRIAVLAASLAAGPASAQSTPLREVVVALFAATPARPADLARRDLSGLDLAGLDFKGANLAGANLFGADLREANLAGADLTCAILDRTILTRTDFSGAILTGASMFLPGAAARAVEMTRA